MIKETLLAAYTTVPEGLGDNTSLGQVGTGIGVSSTSASASLPILVGNIINVVLGALGIIFVVLVIYAGILYFTSAGEKDGPEKAVKILKSAVTGMVLIVAAYAISNFVMGALVTATT